MHYIIHNNNLMVSENGEILESYNEVIQELPQDYEKCKYIIGEKEIEIDVPDYEIIVDDEGNEIQVPIMIEVEETITVIDYDDEGNPIGEHEETITKEVQKTHKETITIKTLVLNPNYEKEKAEKERLRLDSLSLTPADVERALYKAKQMDFDDLKTLIGQALPQVDMKGLAIEFRAKDFYRGAEANGIRLFDVVGQLLGYTSEDMDYLFINKSLPEKEEEE